MTSPIRPPNTNPNLDAILADLNTGMSNSAIATKWNKSKGAIAGIRWRLRLQPERKSNHVSTSAPEPTRTPFDPAARWR